MMSTSPSQVSSSSTDVANAPPAPADILAFLVSYRDAFNALDGVAVAKLYSVPSGIASDTGYTHWQSMEPIANNMVALCQLYRDNGFVATHCTLETYIPQGAQFALVDVHWQVDRTAGQAPWVFNTTYNLVHTPEGWRVLLCTAYSEKPLNR